MADSTPDSTTPKGGGKIGKFIRKNKTLSAVIGIAGVWFGWHELHKNSTGGEEGEVVEGGGVSGSYEGPVPLTRELSHEGVDEEIGRVQEEVSEERRDREEMEREREENHIVPEGPFEGVTEKPGGGFEPGELEGPTTEVAAGQSVTIHGRTFNGATSYHIAKTGESGGGKKYIEYAIQFPGRVEHWQYFTATGNWREANNSATGPGKNKKPTPRPVKGPTGGGGKNKPTGGPVKNPPGGGGGNSGSGSKPQKPHRKKPPSIGPAKPVSSPPSGGSSGGGGGGGGGGGIDGHPNAVKTANQCVNGGVGPHTAPPGYHLFCASDGWIWRAPNG